jgi:hypothetical protein
MHIPVILWDLSAVFTGDDRRSTDCDSFFRHYRNAADDAVGAAMILNWQLTV